MGRTTVDADASARTAKQPRRDRTMRKQSGELRCEVCHLTETQAVKNFGLENGYVFECHPTKPLHKLTGTTTFTRAP
jgi:hypothetical protein